MVRRVRVFFFFSFFWWNIVVLMMLDAFETSKCWFTGHYVKILSTP